MLRSGWIVLCVVLASPSSGQGRPHELPREAAQEDFFPLAIGRVWKYEGQDHGERAAALEVPTRRTTVKRIVGKRTIALPSEEVEAFEIEVSELEQRSDAGRSGEAGSTSEKRGREFAVDRGDRVEIYAASRDGKTGRVRYERTHQWPRTRPQGEGFEEVLWLGRGGRKTWKVTDEEVDLPHGKGKGIRLRWMTESAREEGYEVILAPGVGIVSYRCAVVPCRGPYMDYRETLVAFER